MNPKSCITNLFNKPGKIQKNILIRRGEESAEDEFLQDHHFIIAADLFLKEIELLVGNIDSIKDIHNIQILLTKFEDIEMELDERYESKKYHILTNEDMLYHVSGCKPGYERDINWLLKNQSIMLSGIEEAKKVQSLISELKERKSKVDQRLEELGI